MTANTSAGRSSVRSSQYALVVGGGIVLAIALVVGAGILAEAQATDHARLHAGVALAALLVAGAILRVRPRPSIARRAPVIGLVLFAGAQLVESVGALGYGPDNDTRRNGLAVAHDIGGVATGVALLALVVAVAIAVGALIASRSSRGILVPILVVLGIIAVGLFIVARLIGV
jgi:hypothetical protein